MWKMCKKMILSEWFTQKQKLSLMLHPSSCLKFLASNIYFSLIMEYLLSQKDMPSLMVGLEERLADSWILNTTKPVSSNSNYLYPTSLLTSILPILGQWYAGVSVLHGRILKNWNILAFSGNQELWRAPCVTGNQGLWKYLFEMKYYWDLGLIPGLGKSPRGGHGSPLQYSCLENPHGDRTWWATIHGVTKSQTWLSN